MTTYTINRNGQKYGPYSSEALQRYLIGGSVLPTGLVWAEDRQRWVMVQEIHLTPTPSPTGAPRVLAPAYGGAAAEPAVTSHESRAVEFWKALFRATPTVYVTPAIIAANLIVFVIMVAKGVSLMDPTIQNLLDSGADFGPLTTGGEWWRIFTSTFVHIGMIHILMNMWVLYDIGKFTERLFGHFGFSVMYLLSGVGGSLASLAWHPDSVSAGASGAIFGLYGGLFAFLLIQRHTVPAQILKSLAASSGTFVLYNLIYGSLRQGTDMAAHGGGLLAGFLVGLILAQPLQRLTYASRALRGTLALLLGSAAMAACAAQIPKAGGHLHPNEDGQSQSQAAPSVPDGHQAAGKLQGRVTDGSGAGIAGALVMASDKDGNPHSVTSSDDGSYHFDSLPEGKCEVKFSASGFQESSMLAVTIKGYQTTAVDQQLQTSGDRPQDTPEAGAIRAILKIDDELSKSIRELDESLAKNSHQDPGAAADNLRQLAEATNQYVAAARMTDLSSCPSDFAEAYTAHLAAWAAVGAGLTSLSGNEIGVDDWGKRASSLDDHVSKTWTQVQSIASSYGVQ